MKTDGFLKGSPEALVAVYRLRVMSCRLKGHWVGGALRLRLEAEDNQ
jgi:hypothetical protein